jgi:adenine deaminase
MSVAVKGKWIAYVGQDASFAKGRKTRVMEAGGRTLIPGLIDGHAHLVWLFSVSEFLRFAVAGGTTCVISETMEAYPVAGIQGVFDVLGSFADQPIKIFGTAPTMVSTSKRAAGVSPEALEQILERDDVLGLGESYWQAVLREPDRFLPEMAASRRRGKTLEGHSAGARDRKLCAYLASGISSCHEPITAQEVLERIRLGLYVMIREGSIRRDLEAISRIAQLGVDSRRLILSTDGIEPRDLMEKGYMEYVVQKAVDNGFPPVTAVQMATVNVAEHFGIDHLVGGIAPGRCADMVLVPDPATISAQVVISNGQVAAEKGKLLLSPRKHAYKASSRKTIRIERKMTPADFSIPVDGKKATVKVRAIEMVTDLVSRQEPVQRPVARGFIGADPAAGILKVAAVDRTLAPGKLFTGLIRGFGLTKGALATSSAWDTSDIIVVGAGDADLAAAVNRVVEMQGGAVLAVDGKVIEEIPMPVFGIISDLSTEELARRLGAMESALAELGCRLPDPLLSLAALTGAAIPFFRICEEGLVDFKTGQTMGLFVEDDSIPE